MMKTGLVAGLAIAAALVLAGSGTPALAVVDSASEALKKGSELVGDERLSEAIPYFNRAIQLNPNDARAYEMRASTYAEMSDYRKALEDYTKLIELEPRNAGHYNQRAMVYLQLKEYGPAVDDLSRVIELSRDSMAFYTRGWTYGLLGQHEKAIDDYTRFISDSTDDASRADGYYNRGNEYFELKQTDKAMADFNQAARLDTGRSISSRDVSIRSLGLPGEAVGALVPDYAKAYFRCGLVYNSMGKFDSAVDNFTKAIAINPDRPDFYKMRAQAYEKLGQHYKASADLGKAAALANKGAPRAPGGKAQPPGARGQGAPGADEANPDRFNNHLSDLEKQVLGRTYADELIPDRLARLEQKLLGKPQTGGYKRRLEALLLRAEK